MRKWLSASLVTCGALLLGTGVLAQTPPPAVPEVMPFDIPYGTPLTLDQAKHVADLAFAEAKRHNWKMVISVVDPSGDLIYFERMDGAWIGSIDIAQKKAFTARAFDLDTKSLGENSQSGQQFFGIHASNNGKIMIFAGGIPLKRGGKVVGSIGVSGGSGDQDHAVAEAGAAAF